MKVEVQVTLNTGFYDIEAGGALREYNKTYEMTRERADFFVEKGWVKILREIPDVKTLAEETIKENKPKKTTKKKTTTKKKVTKKK